MGKAGGCQEQKDKARHVLRFTLSWNMVLKILLTAPVFQKLLGDQWMAVDIGPHAEGAAYGDDSASGIEVEVTVDE